MIAICPAYPLKLTTPELGPESCGLERKAGGGCFFTRVLRIAGLLAQVEIVKIKNPDRVLVAIPIAGCLLLK